jgi:hypothetical protein
MTRKDRKQFIKYFYKPLSFSKFLKGILPPEKCMKNKQSGKRKQREWHFPDLLTDKLL